MALEPDLVSTRGQTTDLHKPVGKTDMVKQLCSVETLGVLPNNSIICCSAMGLYCTEGFFLSHTPMEPECKEGWCLERKLRGKCSLGPYIHFKASFRMLYNLE